MRDDTESRTARKNRIEGLWVLKTGQEYVIMNKSVRDLPGLLKGDDVEGPTSMGGLLGTDGSKSAKRPVLALFIGANSPESVRGVVWEAIATN